jgi:hypothetical protein
VNAALALFFVAWAQGAAAQLNTALDSGPPLILSYMHIILLRCMSRLVAQMRSRPCPP